jgi:hypothetical protein
MIPKFSFINGLKKEYSTVMSEDTLKDPITTRLILLSCGHQLGLELITDFFKKFYINESSPITCNVCGMTIKILAPTILMYMNAKSKIMKIKVFVLKNYKPLVKFINFSS